jgi:hypothetical protein
LTDGAFSFMMCSQMSAAATTPDETCDDPAPAWERALLDRQLAALDRLAEMGMAIAEVIHGQVTAQAPEPDPKPEAVPHHAALDFARVARAVRLTYALQSKLIADFKKPPPRAAQAADDDDEYDGPIEVRWLDPQPPTAVWQRHQAKQAVRRMAEGAGGDAETVERLVAEAAERLERDDIYADIVSRPFGETVAAICRDLGIEPDWSLFPDEDWARERMPGGVAASPSSDPHFWIKRRLGRHWRPDNPDPRTPPRARAPPSTGG